MARKVGVWIIGAHGSVSSTTIIGALALNKGLIQPAGMVTEMAPFAGLGFLGMKDLEFGGCDIRNESFVSSCRTAIEAMPGCGSGLFGQIEEDLGRVEKNICSGTSRNCGETIEGLATIKNAPSISFREEISQIRKSICRFRAANDLEDIIVVNLSSTEPPLELQYCHADISSLEAKLDLNDASAVRASTLYSYAAITEGCPYINFTPSNGALFPAMVQLAEALKVPVMGNDGKTGETLVKSALAPMFACRNLEVLSWEGFNILGNLDGKVLNSPTNQASKIRTKDQVLQKTLGYAPHTRVAINYVPSLGDQKTAWDFIHFSGFLGAKMSLQFVWQGYDSLLAAPLVLDLVRLADLAKRRGEYGLMPHLASFFKAPIGVDEHVLQEQYNLLLKYAAVAKSGRKSLARVA